MFRPASRVLAATSSKADALVIALAKIGSSTGSVSEPLLDLLSDTLPNPSQNSSSQLGAIRPARPGDEPHIARFIRDLARYEKLEHQLDLSEARLTEHLFGDSPVCSALLVEHEGKPVGFALFFTSYSTFWCKPCLFLEDLYVDPEFRGHGYGLRLLKALAAEAIKRDCPRLDWHVLDWNQLAIDFYSRQGATVMPDWKTCRLEGDALQHMATR